MRFEERLRTRIPHRAGSRGRAIALAAATAAGRKCDQICRLPGAINDDATGDEEHPGMYGTADAEIRRRPGQAMMKTSQRQEQAPTWVHPAHRMNCRWDVATNAVSGLPALGRILPSLSKFLTSPPRHLTQRRPCRRPAGACRCRPSRHTSARNQRMTITILVDDGWPSRASSSASKPSPTSK